MMDADNLTLEELQEKYPSAPNYLVTIFLISRDNGRTGNTQLARRMAVSKPAVNQAVGRMKKFQLVTQNPYEDIYLTERGRDFAMKVLRKHYLAEYMLIKRLNYPWDKADEEAQRLQTNFSDDFTNYLYDFFGHPETCPHGNPFPGASVEDELINAPRLDGAPQAESLMLLRITEEGEAVEGLLRFCHMHDLHPGARFIIKNRFEDQSMELETPEQLITLPMEYAPFLCYKLQ